MPQIGSLTDPTFVHEIGVSEILMPCLPAVMEYNIENKLGWFPAYFQHTDSNNV